jgi:hypothetical protein
MSYMKQSRPRPIPATIVEPSTELKLALQNELTKLVREPLDAARLQVIQSFASNAKQLLASLDPRINIRPNFQECEMGSMGPYSTAGIASNPETYGASLSRELISAFGKLNKKEQDPVQLISAISAARDKGLTDIADKLEAQLLDKPVAEEPPLLVPQIMEVQ